ncbi:hypothetical protein BFW01_g5838 [Lasiodiplodia theobromae]|nr:hypothetical protein BFW01_g5838 [Lasiodiplodia theobromae]
MVFLKIFEYTSVGQAPFPIDQSSISEQIWASNWGSYKPTDPDFMKSFMMKPATSLQDVKSQLKDVASKLHDLSDVENRMLSAAIRSLPRTSILSHSRLFSGQMDIYQLGLDHLGIEFLECPLNDGPVDRPLVDEFASAMSSYLSVGKTITTKMVLSFTDSIADAMHYSNGLLLVAECPEYSMVWESAAYVTPLSDNPDKTEYTFMPGSRFEVKSVEEVVVPSGDNREAAEKTVTAITLKPKQPKPSNEWLPTRIQLPDGTREGFPEPLKKDEVARLVESYFSVPGVPEIQEPPRYPARSHFRFGHKTGGRRCVCVDEADT